MAETINRCLIIDDDESFRQLITRYINLLLPETIVEEYDPSVSGAPPLDFDWAGCDLVVLDYFLNANLTGLDLLHEWKKQENFPPVIMLTAAGSEDVAVRAMKTGVQDYLRKQNITREKLRQAIEDAVASRRQERERRLATTQSSQSFNKSLFYKKLEEPVATGDTSPVFFLIALDRFEEIGEEYGIVAQDNILRQIAKLTYEAFKAEGYQATMTRMSDATMALLFVPQPDQSLKQESQRLLKLLANDAFDLDGTPVPYTVSIGAVRVADTDHTANAIIRAGRQACKQAAKQGGNHIILFQPGAAATRTEQAEPAPTTTANEVRETGVEDAPATDAGKDKPASITAMPDTAAATEPEPAGTGAKAEAPQPATTEAPAATAEDDNPEVDDKEPLSEEDIMEMTLELPVEQISGKTSEQAAEEPEYDISQAFADNRMLQYYQPIMPLSDAASGDKETYSIRIRMVDTNGDIIDAEQVMQNLKDERNQKLLDRWMLRQTISHIVSMSRNDQTIPDFIIRLSEASFADANLFKWLQNKLMKRLGKAEPGKSVTIEISATTYLAKTRQVDALFKFLRQSYGIRCALSSFKDSEQLNQCIDKGRFDLYKISQKLLSDIQSQQTDPTAIPEPVMRLKQKDIMVISTFIEDAAMLTQAINCNTDFAMGYFIGEPIDNIGEVSQIEAYEIT